MSLACGMVVDTLPKTTTLACFPDNDKAGETLYEELVKMANDIGVCICEAQSGRRKPLSAYMSSCKPDSVQISRLDNLTKPTDNLLKCVKQL